MNLNFFDFPIWGMVYLTVLTALIGLVMGSFLNAWAWRVAHGEKISRGRSHCTACGHVLSALDLIPLFSWLFLKGKCRYCGKKISARYPAAELVCMLLYLSIVYRYGFCMDTLRLLMLGSLLLASSITDMEIMELPDIMTGLMAAASLLRLANGLSELKPMLIGLAAVSVPLLIVVLIMEAVLKRTAMGGGDIKLIAVLGLHFGALKTLFLLIAACFIGLISAKLIRKKDGREFPFGPSIAMAAWLTMMLGDQAVNAYLALFIV